MVAKNREGQYFGIKIKKECVDIQNNKAPSFHLWAKDRNDLKRILTKKNILTNEIDSIVEDGSSWDDIIK
jgi:hypothetical protein